MIQMKLVKCGYCKDSLVVGERINALGEKTMLCSAHYRIMALELDVTFYGSRIEEAKIFLDFELN